MTIVTHVIGPYSFHDEAELEQVLKQAKAEGLAQLEADKRAADAVPAPYMWHDYMQDVYGEQ